MLRTACLALLLSGCSFVLVSGPPANHRELPAVECTTSRLGPVLDTVWAGLHVLNATTAIALNDQQWADNFGGEAPIARTTAIPLYIALASLGVAGMYYGFTRTSRCRAAKAELTARSMQGGGMQQPGVGTWPPPQPAQPPSPPPASDAPPP